MRVLFTLQYLGTRYAGWQRQANATAVQQVFEEALERLYGEPVRVEGAGRTDAGVHALGQRAHADVPIRIEPRGLVLGINGLLPADIRVLEAREVAGDFHCRFRALSKSYAYRIWNAPVDDVFLRETHAHVIPPLDVGRMREAAARITGRHDFRAFTVASPGVSSTLRTIEAVDLHSLEVPRGDGRVISIGITADGFLRTMVRRIAGSLIEVGRGALPPDALSRSLEPSFDEARWTAPAKGLALERVRYEEAGGRE